MPWKESSISPPPPCCCLGGLNIGSDHFTGESFIGGKWTWSLNEFPGSQSMYLWIEGRWIKAVSGDYSLHSIAVGFLEACGQPWLKTGCFPRYAYSLRSLSKVVHNMLFKFSHSTLPLHSLLSSFFILELIDYFIFLILARLFIEYLFTFL